MRAKNYVPMRERYPLRPEMMAAQCRKLATDLRDEHASGMETVVLTGTGHIFVTMSRLEAAISMDAQAERWETEIRTGVLNERDRRAIGEWKESDNG